MPDSSKLTDVALPANSAKADLSVWSDDLDARTERAKRWLASAYYRGAPAEAQRRHLTDICKERNRWLHAAEHVHVAEGYQVLQAAARKELFDALTYRHIGRSVLRALRGER